MKYELCGNLDVEAESPQDAIRLMSAMLLRVAEDGMWDPGAGSRLYFHEIGSAQDPLCTVDQAKALAALKLNREDAVSREREFDLVPEP